MGIEAKEKEKEEEPIECNNNITEVINYYYKIKEELLRKNIHYDGNCIQINNTNESKLNKCISKPIPIPKSNKKN